MSGDFRQALAYNTEYLTHAHRQCNPYINQGSKCAMKADGTVAEEDEIVACSCNADFFNSAIA